MRFLTIIESSYKIAQLCLILSNNKGRGGSSIYKLHMISVALCSKREMARLLSFVEGEVTNYPMVRFDPAVSRAIKYAIAHQLVNQQINGLFRVTEKGKQYVKQIYKLDDLLVDEKFFLEKLSGSLTEELIKTLMASWRYFNVTNQ